MDQTLTRKRNYRLQSSASSRTAAILAFTLLAASIPTAHAETERVTVEYRCQDLLTRAVLQTDTRKIADTLFHTLAVDYPIFFAANTNFYIAYQLDDVFKQGIRISKDWYSGDIAHLVKLVEGVRASRAEYAAPVSQTTEAVWGLIVRDFVNTPSLELYQRWPDLPKESLPDLKMIIQTIDGNETLRASILSVLEDHILNYDRWIKFKENSSKGHTVNRAKAIKVMGGERLANAIPTSRMGARSASRFDPAELSLKKLNEVFQERITTDFILTHETMTHFDFRLRAALQSFSTASVNRSDYFREASDWGFLYEKAGAWLLAKRTEPALKSNFLTALVQAEETLDLYRRYIETERFTVKLAEMNSSERVAYLDSMAGSIIPPPTSPLHALLANDHAKAIGRFRDIDADLKALETSIERNLAAVTEAQASLKSLRARSEGVPRIGNPADFRAEFTRFQEILGLDPTLPKRLEKTTWGFWP